jgi:hypothetical protein
LAVAPLAPAQTIVNQMGVTYSVTRTSRGARITVLSSELLERVAPGKKATISGTESYVGAGNYRWWRTWPASYIAFPPSGLQYDWDVFGRVRAGYPYGFPRWGVYEGTYQGGVVVGVTQRLPEGAFSEAEVPARKGVEEHVPTTTEIVERLLHEGAYYDAIRAFDAYGSQPGDKAAPWPDDRLKALALAGNGDIDAAAETMLNAYLIDPHLASRPLQGSELVPSSGDLRGIVNDCVRRGHKTDTDGLWLLVGVLMQAEGRDAVAAKMIGRSRDRGLDPSIVEAFEEAIGALPAPEPKAR